MQYPWIKNYPEGMPAQIEPGKYTSLVDMLDQASKKHARRIASVGFDVGMTYEALDRHALHFAKWLQSLDLPAGSRVALMMPNVLAYLVALYGTLRAGHVIVNINPMYTPRELQLQLQDSGACVIVVLENFAHTLEQTVGCDDLQHIVVVAPGDMLGVVKRGLVNFAVRHIKKMVPSWHLPNALQWSQVLSKGRHLPWQAPEIELDDLAVLQYTGGTTGQPKGAMLTHGNLVANVLQIHEVARPALREVQDQPLTMMAALPLYHVFAMTICAFYGMHAGMKSLLVINPRDRHALIGIWRKYPVNIIPGVNTLFNALLQEPDFCRLDFSGLRLAFGGGMALQAVVARRWSEVTGRTLIEGYGLSETSPVVTANPTNATAFSGSIGLPVPGTEIKILDEQRRPVEPGERGEIAIRGPQVMRGYWHSPQETANALGQDGFFLTGDIGWMDTEGFVFIEDRKKDLILVSGFKVYPNEVEAVFASHPGVLECAAISMPDAHAGERVKLFVVRKDPDLSQVQLLEWCKTQLARYKCPASIEFCGDLPKSQVGKILRRALRNG
jgi:long-chain acyl-CoA synthetase